MLIEAFSYPGFLLKKIFIPVELLSGLCIILFIIYQFFSKRKMKANSFYDHFMRLNQTLTLPLIILFYILNSLESFNFPNYVFSTYHLHLSVLEKILILNVILSVFSFKLIISKLFLKEINIKISYDSAVEMLFVISVSWIFLLHSWSFVKYVSNISVSYSATLNYSNEEKLVYQLGGNELSGWVYTYGEFINRNTPEDAAIIIPPQMESWQMEGNPWYFRWFVYPRKLLSTQEIVQPFPDEGRYILIAHGAWVWGATQYVWPRVSIPADEIESITYIDRATQQETTVTNQPYTPSEKETWGIIKLKR